MSETQIAERVAREGYDRLLALLAARTRDVAAAEDALADAFAAALVSWPRGGSPENPEAWLFAAAKRKLIGSARRAKTAAQGEAEIVPRHRGIGGGDERKPRTRSSPWPHVRVRASGDRGKRAHAAHAAGCAGLFR